MDANDIRTGALVALMGGAGVGHFAKPEFFDPLVPKQLGSARTWVYASGAVEIACAVLLARRSTRKIGGYLATATVIGVFPGNIQSVIDGGVASAKPPFNTRATAIARLPFQIPMVRTAWKIARES
jgi:uncharacterized membrane protein